MAAPGDALASVAQLLEAGRYDAVAEALDQAELEVGWLQARAGAGSCSITPPSCCSITPLSSSPSLQEPSALSSEQWPHALHLLAHVYAGRL